MPAKKTTKPAKTVLPINTGRRKTSVARVRIAPEGTGVIIVNKKPIDEYFGLATLKQIVRQPMELLDMTNKIDVFVNVVGGGLTGQAGAIRQAIARGLCRINPDFKPELKKEGFLTRDARKKERKKYGLKKARKAPQYSKR